MSEIPHYELIGTEEEIFEQLGKIDKDGFKLPLEHITRLLTTPWTSVNTILHTAFKQILKITRSRNPDLIKNLKIYSEQLGIGFEELAFCYLIPEMTSCMTKWLPAFPTSILGCSSFFILDEETKTPIHGRVLDFPLVGSFDKYERALTYNYEDGTKIFSYSCAGLAFPSLTAMNNKGVTFAIHQKFSDTNNLSGTPFLELIHTMLKEVDSVESTLEFLKKYNSITTWCYYMSFSDGRVLAVDHMDGELITETHQLTPGEVFYFNNKLHKKELQDNSFHPWGLKYFNQMRCEVASKKIDKFKKQKFNAKNLIKMMATPLLDKKDSGKDWKLDTATPSSLHIVTMNAVNAESYFIPGEAPKYFMDDLIHFSKIWEDCNQKYSSFKNTATPIKYKQGMQELIRSLKSLDFQDMHQAYHHIQMSISELEGYQEQRVAQFYFLGMQFINEGHKKVLTHIKKEFRELKDNLPENLNNHCLLFINRLERHLGDQQTVTIDQITDENLKKVFKAEQKIPALILKKLISPMIHLRIDILDVLYTHVK